jgi:hypothetical protein
MIEPVSLLKNPCHTTKNLFPKKLKKLIFELFSEHNVRWKKMQQMSLQTKIP